MAVITTDLLLCGLFFFFVFLFANDVSGSGSDSAAYYSTFYRVLTYYCAGGSSRGTTNNSIFFPVTPMFFCFFCLRIYTKTIKDCKDKNDNELSEVAFTQLLTKLFNKLDWISFLINHDQIKNQDIQEYLKTMIKTHFEQTFEELATDNMKEPSEFKELKKLYQKIKS